MFFYKIGVLGIQSECDFVSYKAFKIKKLNSISETDIIDLSFSKYPINTYEYKKIAEFNDMNLWKSFEKKLWIFEDKYKHGLLCVSADYSSGLFFSEHFEHGIGFSVFERLSYYMIQCALVQRGFLILHASCVVKNGLAIAFSADSGVGKSTRARKWIEVLDAEWVSGDRPVIDSKHGKVLGVPWDGKEKIYRNTIEQLGIIFDLHRSKYTVLQKLSEDDAFNTLLKQLFIPMWDRELIIKTILSLKRVILEIPVYRLFCDQTESAVLEISNIIFEHILHKELEDNSVKESRGQP